MRVVQPYHALLREQRRHFHVPPMAFCALELLAAHKPRHGPQTGEQLAHNLGAFSQIEMAHEPEEGYNQRSSQDNQGQSEAISG